MEVSKTAGYSAKKAKEVDKDQFKQKKAKICNRPKV